MTPPTVIRSPESEALARQSVTLTADQWAENVRYFQSLEARIAALESARQSAVTREVAAVDFHRAETKGR